jgi:tetratricopeptide (TPR) repeat protein
MAVKFSRTNKAITLIAHSVLCNKVCSVVLCSCLVIACCVATGCGGKVQEKDNRTAQVAFDDAIKLVDAGSYSQALPLLDSAIASGGLSADLYAEALLLRSRCYADAGALDKAEADLSHSEQGSPSPAKFQFAKGFLLSKQGKKAEADAAFKAAKKIDPTIKLP